MEKAITGLFPFILTDSLLKMLEFLRHAKNVEKAEKDHVQKEKISNDKFIGCVTSLQKANSALISCNNLFAFVWCTQDQL